MRTSIGGVFTPPNCYFTINGSEKMLHPGMGFYKFLELVNNWFLYIELTVHLDVKKKNYYPNWERWREEKEMKEKKEKHDFLYYFNELYIKIKTEMLDEL